MLSTCVFGFVQKVLFELSLCYVTEIVDCTNKCCAQLRRGSDVTSASVGCALVHKVEESAEG